MSKSSIICDLDHPIFGIMGNETRRSIIRMLSCEENYGNQIAYELGVSNPTIHKHLKAIQKNSDIDLIGETKRTTESFSGHKGAEATMFKIKKPITVFLSIYPNFIHAHTYPERQSLHKLKEDAINYSWKEDRSNPNLLSFAESSEKLAQLNEEIRDLEKQLIEKFDVKNNIMAQVDDLLIETKTLDYDQRMVLRAYACIGPSCYSILPALLKKDIAQIQQIIHHLTLKGWLEKVDS